MATKLVSQQDETPRNTRVWLVASCLVVFIMAAILRVGFAQEVLSQHADLSAYMQAASKTYGFMAGDSPSYLRPADRIAAGDLLHAGSLKRPPGYPLFLWLCGRSPNMILIAQALLGSLIPVSTLLLSHHLLRNLPLSPDFPDDLCVPMQWVWRWPCRIGHFLLLNMGIVRAPDG